MLKKLFTKKRSSIYLDHAAATQTSKSVLSAMKPYIRDIYYNPGGFYEGAVLAQNGITNARKTIAKTLKVRPGEIIFADGGTMANNIAIQGGVNAWKKEFPGKTPHIITSSIEHSSVLETIKYLKSQGCEVDFIDVDEEGVLDMKQFKEAIKETTAMISIGYVNGETGVLQDIKAIAKTIRHYKKHNKVQSNYPLLHTDAVQAANFFELGIPQLGVDLLSVNAAKIYGPKKIAVLFKRAGVSVEPFLFGGSQEFGMVPGTENVAAINGMAQALYDAQDMFLGEFDRLLKLRKSTEDKIMSIIPNVIVNSRGADRAPHILNITIPYLDSEEVVIRLSAAGFMCSSKSACKSGEEGDSHVIQAMRNKHTGSIRFSFGRSTTQQHLDSLANHLAQVVDQMNLTRSNYVD